MTIIKRTYSLVDIAQKIKKPRTTLADWVSQFKEFIPTIGSGRTMRYTEESVEVFGLISRMKDMNEPPEMIRTQLLENFRVITVQTAEEEEVGKPPFMMQLGGDVDDIKRALGAMMEQLQTLTTENDEVRRQLMEGRQEAAAAFERVIRDERSRRIDERFTERRIEKQLRDEALQAWKVKPEAERIRKVGVFRKEEDAAARDLFVRDYIDERFENKIREAYAE